MKLEPLTNLNVQEVNKRLYRLTEGINETYNQPSQPAAPAGMLSIEVFENIEGFQPVIASGYAADSNNLSHRQRVVGIAVNAISSNFSGLVQYSGELANPLWNFQKGDPIFINQKQLSNVAPTDQNSVWYQRVGTAIRPDTILIELQDSVLL